MAEDNFPRVGLYSGEVLFDNIPGNSSRIISWETVRAYHNIQRNGNAAFESTPQPGERSPERSQSMMQTANGNGNTPVRVG